MKIIIKHKYIRFALGPCQTSMMKRFCENRERLSAFKYFYRKSSILDMWKSRNIPLKKSSQELEH